MTKILSNEEILKKAIDKAIRNGSADELAFLIDRPQLFNAMTKEIIFSHDFAKSFWGYNVVNKWDDPKENLVLAWEYHLQKMVLETEPLLYLEGFL